MVMILSQSLDKQGADPVACRTFIPELVRTWWPGFSGDPFEARYPGGAVD